MSLILDALKKSESERQREKTPGLQSIHQPLPQASRRSHAHWWAIAALVSINAAALAYWYLQQSPALAPTGAAPVSAPPPVSSPASAAPAPAAAAPVAVEPEYTQIAPARQSSMQVPAASDARVLEVGELPEQVRNNLPAMTFSFHVYSANPQQRTIIINNRRMREGDEIGTDLLLQEITEDGVILLHAGHRIHIGVLSGW